MMSFINFITVSFVGCDNVFLCFGEMFIFLELLIEVDRDEMLYSR